MTQKKEQFIRTALVAKNEDELRLLPFAVAGLVCFTLAVILGTGTWLVFGTRARPAVQPTAEVSLTAITAEKPETATPLSEAPAAEEPAAQNLPAPAVSDAILPAGTVAISGGEIALGGGETRLPIERVIVKAFAIAETEVTNSQYAEFIKDTSHPAPAGWSNDAFPAGTENYPVTNVSFLDAQAFCEWLGRKLGLTVRLPSEAEWEYAARGSTSNKYPWGAEWNRDAVKSKETGGKISAVKSHALNRSPFGAFDMAGNVWEWTQERVGKNEAVTDEEVKEALARGKALRVVKGGSALIPAAQISVQSRYEIPENSKVPSVGFRYVVERR